MIIHNANISAVLPKMDFMPNTDNFSFIYLKINKYFKLRCTLKCLDVFKNIYKFINTFKIYATGRFQTEKA